ncbi:MAG: hypothetical protein NDJ89_03585 [Oligoflexia bacterium]|nr:hypothetical protein [Oligoflexia bacterium]
MRTRALILSFVIATALWRFTRPVSPGPLSEVAPAPSNPPAYLPARPFEAKASAQAVATATPAAVGSRGLTWEGLQAKYGKGLRAEFGKGGRLASLRGVPGGVPGSADFSPDDPDEVIRRAREILVDARQLLGLQDSLPVEISATKTNPASAQVFFQEHSEGLQLAPQGKIVVDLGPKGELVGLDSDYVPDVRPAKAAVLAAEEAVRRALAALPEPLRQAKVEGGARLIWLAGRDARLAYEFFVEGRQVVVDAENGRILWLRDRRES